MTGDEHGSAGPVTREPARGVEGGGALEARAIRGTIGHALAPAVLAALLAGAPASDGARAQASGTDHPGHGTAGATGSHDGRGANSGAAATEAPLVDAVVRRVDREAGKITLRHAEIPNLNMGPMTMVFGVADPALLTQVRADDRIRFRATDRDGQMVVTEIRKAP
jgi:Cu(I)/Ag(I) efflux system protein CusF